MDLEASRKLYDCCPVVQLAPFEKLFSAGDYADSGIYIVMEGKLATYLDNTPQKQHQRRSSVVEEESSGNDLGGGKNIFENSEQQQFHSNKHIVHVSTLTFGNSIGDLDILDGAPRSVTARAMETGCRLLQINRNLFLKTVVENPRVLQSYLLSSIARLWRVGHFTLRDFLQLPLEALPVNRGGVSNKNAAGTAGESTGHGISSSGGDTKRPYTGMSTAKSQSLTGEQAITLAAAVLVPAGKDQATSITTNNAPVMVHTHYASLLAGWDVLTPEESGLKDATLALLSDKSKNAGRVVSAPSGAILMELDEPVDEFIILLEGSLVVERPVSGKKRKETALVAPGSLIGGGSFLTSTHSRAKAWAVGGGCVVVAVGQEHLDTLIEEAEALKRASTAAYLVETAESDASMQSAFDGAVQSRSASQQSMQSMISACSDLSSHTTTVMPSSPPPQQQQQEEQQQEEQLELQPGAVVTDLLLAAARALGPTIRQFISLGLTREWFHAGAVVYRAGQPAESLYIVISGRARLLHVSTTNSSFAAGYNNNSSAGINGSSVPAVDIRIEDDVGRGDSMGAVWTVSGGRHDTTCLCARDVEAVRMSKASFELLAASRPKAAARVLQGMAERMAAANTSRRIATGIGGTSGGGGGGGGAGKRGEIATIAILPAGNPLQQPDLSLNKDSPTVNEDLEQYDAVSQLAEALRDHLESNCGPTSLLDFATVQRMFPTESEHLDVPFFRSKVTTWLSQQEEDCRFIILQGSSGNYNKNSSSSGGVGRGSGGGIDEKCKSSCVWDRICADQADCILLAAAAHTTDPSISAEEDSLVWKSMETAAHRLQRAFSTTLGGNKTSRDQRGQGSSSISAFASGAAQPLHSFEAAVEFGDAAFIEALQYSTIPSTCSSATSPATAAATAAAATAASLNPSLISLRRVELVLLHSSNALPEGTSHWLKARPHLTRHHHVRLSRPDSVARLSRWMAGTAVGVVLSGGGSRGLAHLGVLRALHDAGVPIDVVGGTSQGAMMAALYAQEVGWPQTQKIVRRYASEMGSARRLASDLTLPLLSVFTGAALDHVVKEAFVSGPHRIEDLWLRFFCVSTNLTIGAPSIHHQGVLWRAVRASMTLIGLVPPVVDETGHLLCDGGYSDNLPVGAMRDQIGPSGTVIVVDVEDRDQSAWHNLTPTDGGVSGWQLLWDRWCPVERWRFGIRIPGHASLMNALTWMAHKQNLARLAREGQRVDLYLRPPVTKYRLMDYHLADRIALEANRYAFKAVAYWQRWQGGRGNVPFSAQQVVAAADLGSSAQNGHRSTGIDYLKRSSTLLHTLREAEELAEEKQQQLEIKSTTQQQLSGEEDIQQKKEEGDTLQISEQQQQQHQKVQQHVHQKPQKMRRVGSTAVMSQLQAKHVKNDEDEETSSSSTQEGLMAPLQMLTRAATAHPNLAANLTFGLTPLKEISSEMSRDSQSMSSTSPSINPRLSLQGEEKGKKGLQEKEKSLESNSADSSTAAELLLRNDGEAEEVKSEGKEDQFAYLDDIKIELDDDDLPS